MTESKSLKDSLESLIKEDPGIQQSIQKAQEYDQLIAPTVANLLAQVMRRVEDKDDAFNIEHGFLTFGKSINYLSQTLCKDYPTFQEELTKSHSLVIDKVMVALGSEYRCAKCESCEDVEGCQTCNKGKDLENFSLRRLMMVAGSIVDYVSWRMILGDYITATQVEDSRKAPAQATAM